MTEQRELTKTITKKLHFMRARETMNIDQLMAERKRRQLLSLDSVKSPKYKNYVSDYMNYHKEREYKAQPFVPDQLNKTMITFNIPKAIKVLQDHSAQFELNALEEASNE